MTIVIQPEVFYIIAITALLCLFCVLCKRSLNKMDPMEKPKGLGFFAIWIVETVDNMVESNTNKSKVKLLAPYIGTLAMYLLVSNLIGLLGLTQPTGNYSVTLALALITVILREREALKTNGLKDYIKGLFDPIPPFIIPNLFGKIAPLVSMSLRLFGNILSGSIIMTLVYAFCSWLSSLVPIIGAFNFIGPIIAPVLHAYFDVFAGCIQMFIFITLTQVYIGNELPLEENK